MHGGFPDFASEGQFLKGINSFMLILLPLFFFSLNRRQGRSFKKNQMYENFTVYETDTRMYIHGIFGVISSRLVIIRFDLDKIAT